MENKKLLIKKIKAIILLIFFLIIFVHIIRVVVNKVSNPGKITDFFGYSNFVILSGSMKPTLNVDDLVIVKSTDKISKGDIISFYENDSVITHRVIGYIETKKGIQYKTRGDNNKVPDSKLVSKENIIGKYKMKIPKVGKLIMFLQTDKGILLIILIVFFFPTGRKENTKKLNNKYR